MARWSIRYHFTQLGKLIQGTTGINIEGGYQSSARWWNAAGIASVQWAPPTWPRIGAVNEAKLQGIVSIWIHFDVGSLCECSVFAPPEGTPACASHRRCCTPLPLLSLPTFATSCWLHVWRLWIRVWGFRRRQQFSEVGACLCFYAVIDSLVPSLLMCVQRCCWASDEISQELPMS